MMHPFAAGLLSQPKPEPVKPCCGYTRCPYWCWEEVLRGARGVGRKMAWRHHQQYLRIFDAVIKG